MTNHIPSKILRLALSARASFKGHRLELSVGFRVTSAEADDEDYKSYYRAMSRALAGPHNGTDYYYKKGLDDYADMQAVTDELRSYGYSEYFLGSYINHIFVELYYSNNPKKYMETKLESLFKIKFNANTKYTNQLAGILNTLDRHNYELHRGFGVRINNKLYSTAASQVRVLIENALTTQMMDTAEEFKDLSKKIKSILNPKLNVTSGFFKGFGARDESTVQLYRSIILALKPINNDSVTPQETMTAATIYPRSSPAIYALLS